MRRSPRRLLNPSRPVNWSHPLNRGLVAEWAVAPLPGWAGGGTLWDLVRGSLPPHDGALGSGVTWQGTARPGGYGQVGFNGSGHVGGGWGASITSAQTTVAAWVYFAAFTTTNPRVFEICDAANTIQLIRDGASRQWATKHTQYQGGVSGVQWGQADNPAAGVAYHACAVFDSVNNTTGFYLDGLPQTGSANSNIGAGTGVGVFYLGDRTDSPGTTTLDGWLDGVRVYSRALSAAEVYALYDQGRRGMPDVWNWLPARFGPSRQGGAPIFRGGVLRSRIIQPAGPAGGVL